MNFDSIDASIDLKSQITSKQKLHWLSLELGVREDNEHVGSGLGGNNSQLLALMSFHHELVNDSSIKIKIDRGLMRWGKRWFERASKKEIRSEVDALIPVPKYTPQDTILNDPRYSLGPNASTWKVLLFAENICKQLASELDKGDTSSVQAVAFALAGFPMETILMAVRKHIQIERLVRHNLDEHPDFGKLLSRINKTVDS